MEFLNWMDQCNIPKLEGTSNYVVWAHLIKIYLKAQDLWKYVDGSVPRPDDDDEDTDALSKWKQFNAQATYFMFQTLKDSDIWLITRDKTAKDVFDSLTEIYGGQSLVYLKIKKQQLFHSFELRKNESPYKGYLRFKDIFDSLAKLGEKPSDKDFVTLFMSVVPPSGYRLFRLEWASMDANDHLLVKILEAMKSKEDQAKRSETNKQRNRGGGQNGLPQGGNGQRSGGGGGNRNGKRCFNCDSPDHLARDCDQQRCESDGNRHNGKYDKIRHF